MNSIIEKIDDYLAKSTPDSIVADCKRHGIPLIDIKPERLPNYVQLERLSLEEFVSRTKSTPNKVSKSGKEYARISDRKKHWIHLIETNNLTCPVTGKTVSYCSYDREDFRKPNTPSTFHYNFYSEDDELFSIDHKMPISKGGSRRDYDNIQPMVMSENFKKKDTIIYT